MADTVHIDVILVINSFFHLLLRASLVFTFRERDSVTGGLSDDRTGSQMAYACFNTIFEVVCRSEDEILLFSSARYGRNDTVGADKCQVPVTRGCDVDVQHPLSRACGGRRKCSIAVNTAFFGDPCGYKEFLAVIYLCIPNRQIERRCSDFPPPLDATPPYLTHGYIASPNYPGKFYMDAECHWIIAVQKEQTIEMTLFDFELDVKRGGKCHDYLDISDAMNRTYFRDCGAMGKQVMTIRSSRAIISFRTEQTSLTQRGFILFFEAIGSGCPLLPKFDRGRLAYYLDREELKVRISCEAGFRLHDSNRINNNSLPTVVASPTSAFSTIFSQTLSCNGWTWDEAIDSLRCVDIKKDSTTSVNLGVTNLVNSSPPVSETALSSLVGIALGVASALLMLFALLFIFCFCRSEKNRLGEIKRNRWATVNIDMHRNDVIDDYEENAYNDITNVESLSRVQNFFDDVTDRSRDQTVGRTNLANGIEHRLEIPTVDCENEYRCRKQATHTTSARTQLCARAVCDDTGRHSVLGSTPVGIRTRITRCSPRYFEPTISDYRANFSYGEPVTPDVIPRKTKYRESSCSGKDRQFLMPGVPHTMHGTYIVPGVCTTSTTERKRRRVRDGAIYGTRVHGLIGRLSLSRSAPELCLEDGEGHLTVQLV